MKKHLKHFLIILTIFAFSIALRLFVFEIYAIPSSSMENTLIPGDKVLVNKLLIGPRMPRSPFEIPWINLIYLLDKDSREKIDEKWWPYRRWKGFSKIKHNDIIVFENPVKEDLIFIKRCIALPGDTLLIKNADVYINGSEVLSQPGIKLRYQVFIKDYASLEYFTDSMNFGRLMKNHSDLESVATIILDTLHVQTLVSSGFCDSVKRYTEIPGKGKLPKPYLKGVGVTQTIDYFGPIVIPYRGYSIELNIQNFHRYKKTIRQCEGRKIRMKDKIIYIDNQEAKTYTFQNDYYFMMGDHRYDSKDSRYIGPVPENRIIGKTRRILFSNKDGVKYRRILKKSR